MFTHQEHDVIYQIPGFASKELMKRCGPFDAVGSQEELAARTEVLRRMRSFEQRYQEACHLIPELARKTSFYDSVVHPDPTKWARISVSEAAEKILGRKDVTEMELYAVQTYLFEMENYFVSESKRFLQKKTFWVRPRQEVEDILRVADMVKQRSKAVDAFAEKAQKHISDLRERLGHSSNEPPSRQVIEGDTWTEDDRTIIRFFLASLQPRRVIQMDPYIIPTAYILKKMNLEYHCHLQNGALTVHNLLLDMGVVAPWEEPYTRSIYSLNSPTTTTLAPSRPTPIVPASLGPTDLYSHDVVEGIRHDFGDMRAYVVDDWDAHELDDGVSIERIPSDPDHVWLHVHIADPTTLLPPTHEIAQQAFLSGASRYWVDRTIPMLPSDVGFHRCSLGSTPGSPDNVMTFSAKIDAMGDIVDYKVRPGIIRNVHLLKYDVVDAALGQPSASRRHPFGQPERRDQEIVQPPSDPNVVEDIKLLEKVSKNMSTSLLRNGTLVFGLPRATPSIEPRHIPEDLFGSVTPSEFRGFPKMTYTVTPMLESGARNIIAKAMVAAGRVASRFFRDRGIPALRRAVGPLYCEQRGGVEALLAARDENGTIKVVDSLSKGVLAPPAEYITTPGPHSLMGVPAGEGYARVTSPLRRFVDMLAHWQIKHALLHPEQPVLYDEPWLARIGEELGVRELEARRMEQHQDQFWAHSFLLRWMRDPARAQREHDPLRRMKAHLVGLPLRDGQSWTMVCKVFVEELGLNGQIHNWPEDRRSALGEEVEVELTDVQLGLHPQLVLKLL